MFLQLSYGSGQFELQIVKVENNDNTLRSGNCCGNTAGARGSDECLEQCNTAVALCLKEWSAAAEQQGSIPGMGAELCTYGYNSTGVLGPSSFTLTAPPENGHLHLRFTFSWTVSKLMSIDEMRDSGQ